MIGRREFITLLGSAVGGWPLRTGAQERIPKIGMLRTNPPPDPFVDAFRVSERCEDANRHAFRFCMPPPLVGRYLDPGAALLAQCLNEIIDFDIGEFHL
jgi:hypothetical protein